MSSKRRSSLGNLMDKFRQKHNKFSANTTTADPLLTTTRADTDESSNNNVTPSTNHCDAPKSCNAGLNSRRRFDSENAHFPDQLTGYDTCGDARDVKLTSRRPPPPPALPCNRGDLATTPMGALLSSSLSSAQAGAHFGGNRVGPEEFLQLFNRNRAYSDCNNDTKEAALNACRARKVSVTEFVR